MDTDADKAADKKARNRASQARWRAANKEAIWLYQKAYRDKNKARRRAYNQANKEQRLAADRQRKYGITAEDYNRMLTEQNHECKICSIKFNDNYNLETKIDYAHSQYLDHCHTTNKIRGILCPSCNTGLGQFKDNPEILTKAINYLQETA